VRINGRLITAVTLVPAAAAAIALYVPWRGSNMTMLTVGWILTLMGCGGLLASRDQVRHLGWAAFLASVVYIGIVILIFGLALQAAAGPGDN
jgi:hypothetical protein